MGFVLAASGFSVLRSSMAVQATRFRQDLIAGGKLFCSSDLFLCFLRFINFIYALCNFFCINECFVFDNQRSSHVGPCLRRVCDLHAEFTRFSLITRY